MAVVPLLVPMDQAVPMVNAWGWTVNALLLLRLRAHLSWRLLLPMVGGAALGLPLGLAFLRGADETLVKGTLGVVILGYALLALAGGVGPAVRPVSDRWGMLAGLLGGALGAAFNTSGPPVVIYASVKGWDKDLSTSTLQAFFTFSSTFSMVGFWSAGLFTPQVVRQALPVFPLVWLGILVGGHLYDRVPQARFRALVLALLVVLGGQFLVRAVLAFAAG